MRSKNRPLKSKSAQHSCRTVASLILDYLNDTLEPETAAALDEHMCRCRDCVAFLNTYKTTVELTRSFLGERDQAEPTHPRELDLISRKMEPLLN